MSIWKTEYGWRAAVMVKGTRIQAKGFFQKKSEAQAWSDQEKKRLKEQASRCSSSGSELLLFDLVQRYLEEVQFERVRRTFDEKRFCLERLYRKVGDVDIRQIQPIDVADFLLDRAKTKSNNASNKDRKNLKAFFAWVNSMFGTLHDPTAPIKKKPHTSKTRRMVPLEDIIKVFNVAEGEEKALFGAYWHTGARKQEILRWQWDTDIDFENRRVRLGTLKGGGGMMEYDYIAMNGDLYNLLQWQFEHRVKSSPFVFCHRDSTRGGYEGRWYTDNRDFVKDLCTRAGVTEFNHHDIRHTVGRYLNHVQRVGMKGVQSILRHRRQGTTEIYIGGNYNDTRETVQFLELENLMKAT